MVIPVRVPREIAQKIKDLVNAGLYPNRSDLIREALRRLIASEGVAAQKNLGKVAATIASTLIAWNEKAATDVILFGSVVREETTVESDIDLLVLVKNAEGWVVRHRLYDLIYPIILALGVHVSLIVVNKRRFTRMIGEGYPFALSVIQNGIQLHGGFLESITKAHLEKAVERLRVAEKLFSDGDYEDVVSRAYYAMYHAARAALSTVNVFPKTHEGVVSEFGRKFVLAGNLPKKLGKNFC